MPATTMTHYVRSMLEAGHVERAASSSDRRSYRLVLTPAGRPPTRERAPRSPRLIAGSSGHSTIDEEEAGVVLRAIGRAAGVAETRLASDSIDATA